MNTAETISLLIENEDSQSSRSEVVGTADVAAVMKERNDHPMLLAFAIQKSALQYPSPQSWLPVFAQDLKTRKRRGAKRYWRGGHEEFYRKYEKTTEENRCFYELLLPNMWTHLYVDIDADLTFNPGLDTNAVCVEFALRMREFVTKEIGGRHVRFVRLDSGTASRMSVHYIIKLDRACFLNNFHCGAFMRRFQRYVVGDNGNYGAPFFVKTKHNGEVASIFDMAVYTLHRVFRVFGSHKIGSDRILWRTGRKDNTLRRETFLDTLVQYFPSANEIDLVVQVLEWDGSLPKSTSHVWQHLPSPPGHGKIGVSEKKIRRSGGSGRGGRAAAISAPSVVEPGLSSALAKYISQQHGGCSVRETKPMAGVVNVYLNSRECRLRGESHDSNHIYVVVYLRSGEWVQRCHSSYVTCDGKETERKSLPKELAQRCAEAHRKVEENEKNTIIDLKPVFAFLNAENVKPDEVWQSKEVYSAQGVACNA